jgi:hypothetical protein
MDSLALDIVERIEVVMDIAINFKVKSELRI